MEKTNFFVQATLVTPLCQIDSASSGGKMMIYIKKRTEIIDDMIIDIPIYTGNGFRGLLRRVMAKLIISAAGAKGIELTASDLFIMINGGGSNYSAQSIEVENKVRQLNPQVSLFGVSLAIAGRLIVTDLVPINPLIREYSNDDNDTVFSKSGLIKKMTFTTKDDVLVHSKYGKLINENEMVKWIDEQTITQNKRKQERNEDMSSEEKTKKTGTQAIFQKEYIVPGTTLKGNISVRDGEISMLEYGLLLKTLEEMTKETLGSSGSIGFGIANYRIDVNKKNIITSIADEDYQLEKNVNTFYADHENKAIKTAEKWLNNITEENVCLKDVLINNAKKNVK